MSLEEKPESQQGPQSEELHSDDFPSWVFDEDFRKSREQVLEDIEFTPRNSRENKKVVELFPLPRRQPVTEPVNQVCDFESESDEDEELEDPPGLRSPEQLERARLRQSLFFQTRRAQKKRRVFYNRIRAIFKVVSAFLLLILMYVILALPMWQFDSRNFKVHGSILVTQSQLAPYIRALDGKPLYLINPLELAATIQAELPYAAQVYVRRHLFPVGLDIAIVEKPAWGVLYTNPSRVLAQVGPSDKSAQKAKARKMSAKPMLLLHWDNTTTDLSPFQVTPAMLNKLGTPIQVISDTVHIKPAQWKAYRELVQILSSQPGKARLLYLNISNPSDVTAKFDGFNVRIGRLDGSLRERVIRLFNVLPAVRQYQTEIQWVDLRWHQQVLFKRKSQERLAAELKAQQEQPATAEREPAVQSQGVSTATVRAPQESAPAASLTTSTSGSAIRH